MKQEELSFYINEAMSLEDAIKEACKNISLATQSLVKLGVTISHLNILKDLSMSYNRLSCVKLLTISIDNLDLVEKAELVEELAGGALESLSNFIFEKSGKNLTIKKYVDYAIEDAFNLNEERLMKLLKIIENGIGNKKIDKRESVKPEGAKEE